MPQGMRVSQPFSVANRAIAVSVRQWVRIVLSCRLRSRSDSIHCAAAGPSSASSSQAGAATRRNDLTERFIAYRRHPVTHRQMRISAASKKELAGLVETVEEVRRKLELRRRVGKSIDELERLLVTVEHGKVTVARAAEAYAKRKLSAETRKRVKSFLRVAAPACELDALDGPAAAQWIESLRERSLQDSTILTHWRTLTAIARFATEKGWLTRIPWGIYKPILHAASKSRRRECARSVDEVVRILEAARALDHERALAGRRPNLEAKIAFAICLGLRQSELARLRWAHLVRDERTGECTVRLEVEAKHRGGAPSTAVLVADPGLFEIAGRYEEALKDLGLYDWQGPVFPDPHCSSGRVRPYEGGELLARRNLRAVIARAHLPNPDAWSAHSLRDTFVTLEAEAFGGDLAAVADRSRHESTSALVRYLHTRSRDAARPGFLLPPAQK